MTKKKLKKRLKTLEKIVRHIAADLYNESDDEIEATVEFIEDLPN